jgi:hypothetical protein
MMSAAGRDAEVTLREWKVLCEGAARGGVGMLGQAVVRPGSSARKNDSMHTGSGFGAIATRGRRWWERQHLGRSCRRGSLELADMVKVSSAAAQDEASPLEHGMRDVQPGWSQMERKRARPWRCDSTRLRRKKGGRAGSGWWPRGGTARGGVWWPALALIQRGGLGGA